MVIVVADAGVALRMAMMMTAPYYYYLFVMFTMTDEKVR